MGGDSRAEGREVDGVGTHVCVCDAQYKGEWQKPLDGWLGRTLLQTL